jgi:hypothetical protein
MYLSNVLFVKRTFIILAIIITGIHAQIDSAVLRRIHTQMDSLDHLLNTVYTQENYTVLWQTNRDSSNKLSAQMNFLYTEYDSLFFSQYVRCTSIKKALKNPEEVYFLDLSGKGYLHFPKKIFEFYNLEILDLSGSEDFYHHCFFRPKKKIKEKFHKSFRRPMDRGFMRSDHSKGSHNYIKHIPISIVQLKNLKRLYLDGEYLKDWEYEMEGIKLLLPNCEVN